MKALREILGWVSIALAIGLLLTPNIYWFFNAELTKMEIFIKFWWMLIAAILLFGLGLKGKRK